ncbi:hypothetical protein IV203_014698 [Nitzschia inconspicua]|uniref:Uncharacterized protein n=1 Tax=Nitzschia inconspicua TaxID=303405 RepID=A0A9K3LCB5_9STRA|nr:hypothetical protein IV203_014698 [Nitzschia inconspicua]
MIQHVVDISLFVREDGSFGRARFRSMSMLKDMSQHLNANGTGEGTIPTFPDGVTAQVIEYGRIPLDSSFPVLDCLVSRVRVLLDGSG